MDFTGKTAVVTGGSRGIGRAVCLELAKGGASVVLCCAGNMAAAEETVKACEAAGGRAMALRCGVTDAGQVKALMDVALGKFGRIDILVNNAGITKDGLILRMKDADFDQVVQINLRGAFLCLREAAKIMTKQRRGRIVNITSVVGQMGNAGQVNYSAAKAGLIGLTKSAAKELAARSITVNAVAPGFVETDMTAGLSDEVRKAYAEAIPLRRLGTAQDIAEAVAFLASPGASYITGQILGVNGGMYC